MSTQKSVVDTPVPKSDSVKQCLLEGKTSKQYQDDFQKFQSLRIKSVDALTTPGTEVYVVDSKWIDAWRANTNSNSAGGGGNSGKAKANSGEEGSKNKGISSQHSSKDNQKAVRMTAFTNQRLVIPRDTLLCCGDQKNPYNNIIKSEMQLGVDYQLISKEQWSVILGSYTSPKVAVIPIKRLYEKLGVGIRSFVELHYQKFEIYFIYPFQQKKPIINKKTSNKINISNNDGLKTIYFSGKKSWDDLKQRILKIIKDNQDIMKEIPYQNISKDHFRMWRCGDRQVKLLSEQVKDQEKKYNTKGQQLTLQNDSESGLGSAMILEPSESPDQLPKSLPQIFIKGFSLEPFMNHSIESIIDKKPDSKAQDQDEKLIIVIEIGDQSKNFMLQSSIIQQAPEIFSKCQYCYKQNALNNHCKCLQVSYCSNECQIQDLKYHQEKCNANEGLEDWDQQCAMTENARMGLTGLKNLKNSCYMSSSIQCLSHAVGLTNYFLLGYFKSELNYKNPLGAQGQLAISFAKLIKQLWYDDKPSLAPWQFKKTIGKFSKHFNNFDQQDSQELLNFILDGLHEDLNRVQHKPLVPQIESEGLDDERDAEESWQNHLKRNQSIIVDLMHGQFKGTVRCPDCDKVSITFDPYMSISLPIPEIKIVEKEFFWVPYDTSKRCIKNSFRFKSHEQIKNLRKYIASLHEMNQEQFEIVIIQDDVVKRILPRYEQISILNANNVFIFAIETNPKAFQPMKNQLRASESMHILNEEASEQMQQTSNNFFNDKKGATELNKKLKSNYIQTVLNFEIHDITDENNEDDEPEKVFPRLAYLRLNESLIQTHLDIFEYLRPMFTLYLEHKEGISSNCKQAFLKKKNLVQVPPVVKSSQLWHQMTVSQQYEAVFGGSIDPSRKKIQDLPYQINIISRKVQDPEDNNVLKCVYCQREECERCPLPFDDRITLQDFLNKSGISTQSYYYYEDPKTLSSSSQPLPKDPRRRNFSSQPPLKRLMANLEFELSVSFNSSRCWALFENLVRFLSFEKVYPGRMRELKINNQTDKVTIDDCFRQFMTPEKLSHQNTWFCNRCFKHKQAVKKIQIFKAPPILIINLKRFKGSQQKQNQMVQFPVNGLDMSEYVISQQQKSSTPLIYDLFGVSNHYGQLLAGHYTAYAKNSGHWYRFNDDQVDDVDQSQIVSNAAYNLFYARRDIDFEHLNYMRIKNVLKSEQQQLVEDQNDYDERKEEKKQGVEKKYTLVKQKNLIIRLSPEKAGSNQSSQKSSSQELQEEQQVIKQQQRSQPNS